MLKEIDLTVSEAFFEDGEPAVTLKIQGPMFELNIWMRSDELPLLEQVSAADWAGECRFESDDVEMLQHSGHLMPSIYLSWWDMTTKAGILGSCCPGTR
jgi:hypothetical protein